MKKYLILVSVVCMAAGALAQSYNLRGDWNWGGTSNPNGAWSYGARNEATPGVFDPFVAHTTESLAAQPGWDQWTGGGGNNTCAVFATVDWNGWSFSGAPAPNVILNAWTTYSSAVHWAGDAGTYNVTAAFITGGYLGAAATEDYPDSRIFITKNGSDVVFADELFGYSNVTPGNNGSVFNGQITIAPGDYLDFFVAGNPEVRAALSASLTAVPEPASLALLGLGGLLLALRRQR